MESSTVIYSTTNAFRNRIFPVQPALLCSFSRLLPLRPSIFASLLRETNNIPDNSRILACEIVVKFSLSRHTNTSINRNRVSEENLLYFDVVRGFLFFIFFQVLGLSGRTWFVINTKPHTIDVVVDRGSTIVWSGNRSKLTEFWFILTFRIQLSGKKN